MGLFGTEHSGEGNRLSKHCYSSLRTVDACTHKIIQFYLIKASNVCQTFLDIIKILFEIRNEPISKCMPSLVTNITNLADIGD